MTDLQRYRWAVDLIAASLDCVEVRLGTVDYGARVVAAVDFGDGRRTAITLGYRDGHGINLVERPVRTLLRLCRGVQRWKDGLGENWLRLNDGFDRPQRVNPERGGLVRLARPPAPIDAGHRGRSGDGATG